MANEIQADYASGSTLYAVLRNRAGQVWRPAQHGFESWGAGGHTANDYGIALTDRTGSRYVGDFAAAIPSGSYCIQVFWQAGATPVDADPLVCSREILWTGRGELTPAKFLANKSVQDQATLAIDYYDDDGQTILLTHTVSDDEFTTTRTPQ